jgi:site-specific recombinase XerD
MTDIDEAIRTYLVAIEIEGKSPRTVASYANSLEDFRRVGRRLGHPDSPEAYAVPHVYEFLGALRERGASPGYQHRRHREVKTCFSWLKRMDFIEDNVFAKVPLVRRPRVVKPPFTPEQITALLETQDRSIRKC